jgi:hypothetical protein
MKLSLKSLKPKLFSVESSQILALIVSVIAIFISYKTGNITSYNDATAHLDTARRVIDSLTPGPVQLGSVWLPLLHILLIPFVSIDILWRTGLAGSIVSGACFLLANYYIYRLVYDYTKSHSAAFIGALVLILNLNFLYMQTTAMFEPLLIATVMGAVYHLSRWSTTDKTGNLVLAAIFTLLASMTRYDGWAFFLAACAYVALVTASKHKGEVVGKVILFGSLAALGISLWLLYNLLIFGNPLYFANGSYSAASQQVVLQHRGQLPSEHNISISALIYGATTLLDLGVLVAIIGTLGFLWYCVRQYRHIDQWAPLLLLVPLPFNVLALYMGQSVIWVPMVAPHLNTFFNARYGILMLPAAAFFIAYLSSRSRVLKVLVVLVLVGQALLMAVPNTLPLFGEGIGVVALRDTVSSVNSQTVQAAGYIHDHYNGGLILCSTASSDAFVYRTGLHLSDFITEGNGHYWTESLSDPTSHATWIVFFGNHTDRVGIAMAKNLNKLEPYHEVYSNQTYEIWELRGSTHATP